MKKIKIASVFLVLIMLFLSSCSGDKASENTTTFYDDYNGEYLKVYGDNSSMDASGLFDKVKDCLSLYPDDEKYRDETVLQERTALIFGEETTLYYENTLRHELTVDLYYIKSSAESAVSEGSVMFLHGTDTIVRVIREPDEETGAELTKDEITAIAKDFAKEWCDFLNTDNYKAFLQKISYGQEIYTVLFKRQINGITTNDFIEVFVTKCGTVTGWGNIRNPYAKSVTNISVDIDLCKRSITKFVLQDSSILSTMSPEIINFKDTYSISFAYDGTPYCHYKATLKVGGNTVDIPFYVKIGEPATSADSTDVTMENSVVTNETAEIAAE